MASMIVSEEDQCLGVCLACRRGAGAGNGSARVAKQAMGSAQGTESAQDKMVHTHAGRPAQTKRPAQGMGSAQGMGPTQDIGSA